MVEGEKRMLKANLYAGRKKYPNRRWFKYSSKPLFTMSGNLRSSLDRIYVVGDGRSIRIRHDYPFYADTVIAGKTIYPRGKYLSIPMSPRLNGKTPRDYYGKGRFVKGVLQLPNRRYAPGIFFVVGGKPYFYMARKVEIPRRDLFDFTTDQLKRYMIPLLDEYVSNILIPELEGAMKR